MPDTSDVIAALVAETRPALTRNGWGPASCLPAARVAIEVLGRYGIEALPSSVSVVAMNPTATQMKGPKDPVPDGVPPPTVRNIAYKGPADPWQGHVVLLAAGQIIDLTIDQLDVPANGLTIPPMSFPVPRGFTQGERALLQRDDGCRIVYRAWPDDLAYQTVPDWAHLDMMQPLVEDLQAAVEARVGPPDPPEHP